MYETKFLLYDKITATKNKNRYIIFYTHKKIPTTKEQSNPTFKRERIKFNLKLIFTNPLYIPPFKEEKETCSTEVYRTSLHRKRVPISSGIGEEREKKRRNASKISLERASNAE